jgi:hypothetical protein
MRRNESLLVSMEFTTAKRAYKCDYNKDHPLEPGAACLAVRDAGGVQRYCVECARALLVRSAERLRWLLAGADHLAKY